MESAEIAPMGNDGQIPSNCCTGILIEQGGNWCDEDCFGVVIPLDLEPDQDEQEQEQEQQPSPATR